MRTGQDTPARRGHDERGSASVWVIIVAIAALTLTALITDGNTRLRAARTATLTASEAARTGAQQLAAGVGVGQPAQIDPDRGPAAARAYLASAGVAGDVAVAGPAITVTTRVPWQPQFFTFAAKTLTGTSTATVRQP